jgi:ABC-type antimicrobial peptide transport system permease subunit
MNILRLIIQSFRHYLKANLWVAMGVAISTAVLTGGLIVGDSVKYSLEQTVAYRLGNTTHTLTSGERYFTTGLSDRLKEKGIPTSAALKLEGIASSDGGQLKLNNIQVWGIDEQFSKLAPTTTSPSREVPIAIGKEGARASISSNLALRLNLAVGDEFQLRIEKGSLLPANAPFVSDEHQTESTRLKVAAILTQEQLGRLSLQNSQTAPYNIFLPIDELNRLSEMVNRANVLLIQSEKKISEIELTVRESWTLDDAGLTIVEAASTNQWELRSGRVFMDQGIRTMIDNTGLETTPLLTYFANRFQSGGKETPYSFVSSLPDSELPPGEVVVNSWLANDLKIKVGDSLSLFFYEIGPLRELTETSQRFKVARIEPMSGYFSDRLLMPDIPGLSNAENCRDWQTGVPVNLKAIRKIDEDYWYNYRGVPKAFIAYSEAEKLWGNRFGNATAYRFNQQAISKDELTRVLTEQLDPFAFDLQLKDARSEGLQAAKNGTDFSSLFIGLSFFILVAGLLLTSLLFVFNIEKRRSEIGTLSSLGFKKGAIQKMFLIEGGLVSLLGAIPGLLLAMAYNELVFCGLNRVWNDIVRTDLLISHYRLSTLLIGLLISVLVSMATIWLVLRKALKRNIVQLQRKQTSVSKRWIIRTKKLSAFLLGGVGIGVLVAQLTTPNAVNAEYFFMAGGLLLIVFLLIADLYLSKQEKRKEKKLSVGRLVVQNLKDSRSRSLMVIILLAIGTFLVVSTGMNRQDLFGNAGDKKSGTGGYLYWAESTVPVLHNLNDSTYRKKEGFTEQFSVVQFSLAEGDDASCLNLNRIANPRILGVDATLLDGRFSFQTFADGEKSKNGWAVLKDDIGDCIPAIADQTVIQWSLGKKVGDTLIYKNPAGEEIKLKLMAGLAASVFQGNVLIDQSQFLKNFPTASGSKLFLIDGTVENKEAIADELQLNYREMGWEMTSTAERLATFKSIENTYLSIFLALGALGLLIGTIGLAIVLQRSVLARKAEFSLLMAVGYSRKRILSIVVLEYFVLLIAGVAGGFITAIIAVWPAVSGAIQSVSFGFVSVLIGLILLNGLGWIVWIAAFQLRRLRLVEALRNE